MALVTRDNDHKISVLSIDGNKVEYTKRDIIAGLRPYGIDINRNGEVAVVANIGLGRGDADTVSVIDLGQAAARRQHRDGRRRRPRGSSSRPTAASSRSP